LTSVKINFENINFTFEGITIDKSRLQDISNLIFELLNKKIEQRQSELNVNSSDITLYNLTIQPISISPTMSDQEIAELTSDKIFEEIKNGVH
jgi:hypothetical protein